MRRLAISSEGIACCDDSYVDIAAHYLVPVLFRDSHDGDGSKTTKAVEAEKALKRCLKVEGAGGAEPLEERRVFVPDM